jgi:hypothetical protein
LHGTDTDRNATTARTRKRYSSLIPHDLSSTIIFDGPDLNPFYAYGLGLLQQPIQSKAYFSEDYVAMLAEDTNKFMEKLAKKLEDVILGDYTVGKTIASLPMLPSKYEDTFP